MVPPIMIVSNPLGGLPTMWTHHVKLLETIFDDPVSIGCAGLLCVLAKLIGYSTCTRHAATTLDANVALDVSGFSCIGCFATVWVVYVRRQFEQQTMSRRDTSVGGVSVQCSVQTRRTCSH